MAVTVLSGASALEHADTSGVLLSGDVVAVVVVVAEHWAVVLYTSVQMFTPKALLQAFTMLAGGHSAALVKRRALTALLSLVTAASSMTTPLIWKVSWVAGTSVGAVCVSSSVRDQQEAASKKSSVSDRTVFASAFDCDQIVLKS
jgi:hypothetical protein